MRKYFNNIPSLVILFTVAYMLNGCTKDFDDLNTNEKGLTESNTNTSNIGKFFSFTNYAVMSHSPVGATPWIYQVTDALFPDYYAQYFATTQPRFPSDRHTIVGGWNNAAWNSTLKESAPTLRYVIEKTAEFGLPKENAIAKIWEVFQFHRFTDYYGPIPYTHFGNGKTSVPYDSQESVYKSFFPILDEAVAELKSGGVSLIFQKGDLIYSGDLNKWYKFANSLRLRLAMRIRFADPQLAKKEAEKAILAGVIENVADNAFVETFPASPNAYDVITAWGEFRMSASMESVLKGYNDPRTPKMYSPAAGGDSPDDGDSFPYEGMLNGQSIASLEDGNLNFNENTSDMAPQFTDNPSTPIAVLRAAEVYFLRAEGALIGWNMGGGTAKEYYEAGINASLEEWGVATSSYATSTAVPAKVSTNIPAMTDIPVLFNETDQEKALEQIITQKWISLYPDSREAWAELRRTGYPKLYTRLNSENAQVPVDAIMRRLTYPPIEFETNTEAVNEAISSEEIGAERNGSTKLWWDKRKN